MNPVFNLKAVLQETGIAADTLRAWERRYGLPMPKRTAGGHRLYSQFDIKTIKWLMSRQKEGLSISRAVELWREISSSGGDPLAGISQMSIPITDSTALLSSTETSLDGLRIQWLNACLDFNESLAEGALNQAFALYPVEMVCTEVLQRGIAEIGTQWYMNEASVQQEHFTTALAMRRLDSLLSAAPPPTRSHTVLLACPAEEWHTFTPLLLSLLLRRRGLNVIYLGANVPNDRLAETIKTTKANMIVLAAQQLTTAASTMEAARTVIAKKVLVSFGGRIFALQPILKNHIAGHYLGDSLSSAVDKIQDLVTHPTKNPLTETPTQEYDAALLAFESTRTHIEARLSQIVGRLGFSAGVMRTATEFIGNNIIAALKLGRMSLLDGEIEWLSSLLRANHVPQTALGEYLGLYSEALTRNINGSGQPISDWFTDQISRHSSDELLLRE